MFNTIIDTSLNNGLGAVILKNNIALQDTLNWGIGVCKHANGKDWWVVMMKDSSDIIFKILLTSNGIVSVSSQHLNYLPLPWGHTVQLMFSPDGKKFSTTTYFPEKSLPMDSANSSIVLFDFDRCTGIFSNDQVVKLMDFDYIWGQSFSPSGKYVYACSSNYIFQIDTEQFNC